MFEDSTCRSVRLMSYFSVQFHREELHCRSPNIFISCLIHLQFYRDHSHAKTSLVHFMLSVTITSLSATTSPPLRLQSLGLPWLDYTGTRMCALVYVYMWLSKGSIHAASRMARYCRVTVDLFSSWLLLLEVLTGTQIAGIDFAQPQWKKKRKKKEGCYFNARFSQTRITFQLSSPPFCHPLQSPK